MDWKDLTKVSKDRFGIDSAEYCAVDTIEWTVGILSKQHFYFGPEVVVIKTQVATKKHLEERDEVETCIVEIAGVCAAQDGTTHTVRVSVPMEWQAWGREVKAQHAAQIKRRTSLIEAKVPRAEEMVHIPSRSWLISRGIIFGTIDGVEYEMRFSGGAKIYGDSGDDYWIRLKGSDEPWLVGGYPTDGDQWHKPAWEEDSRDNRLKAD